MTMRAAAATPDRLLTAVHDLAGEYRRAMAEASTISQLCLDEVQGLMRLIECSGNSELHRLAKAQVNTLSERIRFATSPPPTPARH